MSKNTYSVYCHTNKINGKKYIGITRRKPELRWGSQGWGYQGQIFFNAIQVYGWDNFEHEILYTNLSLEEANEKEKELIKKYDSVKKGYNVSYGGSDNAHFKRKVKQYSINGELLNTYDSAEDAAFALGFKPDSSICSCCNGKIKSSRGYIWRYENDDFDKYDTTLNKKPVSQYSLDGKYIRDFESEIDAVNEVKTSGVYNCCLGNSISSGGYIWRFSNGDKDDLDVENISFIKEIVQYDKNGKLINTYKNAKDASLATNTSHSHLLDCCKRKVAQCNGYIWRYSYDIVTKEDIIMAKTAYGRKMINQYSIEGEFLNTFYSITEIKNNVNSICNTSNISQCCNGNRKTAGGYKWFYADDPNQPDKKKSSDKGGIYYGM